jgi:hypothetical protein
VDGVRAPSPPSSPKTKAPASFFIPKPVVSLKEEIERQMDQVSERIKTIDFMTYPRRKGHKKSLEQVTFNSEFAASVHHPETARKETRPTVLVTPQAVQELAQTMERRVTVKVKKQNGFEAFANRE